MRTEELINRYPQLHHVAADQSWPSIRRHGLLSTTRICDLYGVEGEDRTRIVREHRPESVVIEHPDHGRAVIRDQKPMRPQTLERILDGITVGDWFELLNSQVFFWPTTQRRDSMLNAVAYRNTTHTVLTVSTARLLDLVDGDVRISRLNSGATLYDPPKRGRDLFMRLADYPSGPFAELTVPGGAVDVEPAVLAVERFAGARLVETVEDRR